MIVILVGKPGAGKTTYAKKLEAAGYARVSTSALIRRLLPSEPDLVAAGRRLDEETDGAWIAEAVAPLLGDSDVVVDCVRGEKIAEQAQALLVLGPGVIVGVTAREEERRARLEARGQLHRLDEDDGSWEIFGDAWSYEPDRIAEAMAERRGFADVIVGGQYGSEGKGHVAARIAPEYGVLVRSGGPNAGHTVDKPGGGTFCFKLLPSGSFAAPRATLAIAPGATIVPELLLSEARAVPDGLARLAVDPLALVIDEADLAAEAPLMEQMGSTSRGGGNAAARRILERGSGRCRFARDVPELLRHLRPLASVLGEAERRGRRVLLEGTQGSGLSLYHGPWPHVTSRDTNAGGLLAECGVAPGSVDRVLAVFRRLPIRVAGSSGPMRGELTWDEVSRRSGVPADELRERERTSTTHRLRRVAEWDWDLFRTTCRLNRPTHLALTFADYDGPENRSAPDVENLLPDTREHVDRMELASGSRVAFVGTGPGRLLATGAW